MCIHLVHTFRVYIVMILATKCSIKFVNYWLHSIILSQNNQWIVYITIIIIVNSDRLQQSSHDIMYIVKQFFMMNASDVATD